MLAVAVELEGGLVPLPHRIEKPRLDGASDAEVAGKIDDRRGPGGARLRGGLVGGPVVHHENVQGGVSVLQRPDDASDGLFLVVGGDDGQSFQGVSHHRYRKVTIAEMGSPSMAV